MSTNTAKIILSAVTAGCISGFGSIVVVGVAGYTVNSTVCKAALFVGILQAAKDVRSMMHLPPVDTGGAVPLVKKQPPTPPTT